MSGEAYPPDDSTYSDRDAPVPGLRTAPMIAIGHLTTRYRNIAAVDGLSFDSGPGRVAGFLGSHGAGKDHHLADAARPGPARRRDRHHQRARTRPPRPPSSPPTRSRC